MIAIFIIRKILDCESEDLGSLLASAPALPEGLPLSNPVSSSLKQGLIPTLLTSQSCWEDLVSS